MKRNFAAARRAIGQSPVGAHGGLAIEHQAEPLIPAEIGAMVLFGQLPVGGCHAGEAEGLHLVEGRVGQHHDVPFLH
jgi:hypothetical protein